MSKKHFIQLADCLRRLFSQTEGMQNEETGEYYSLPLFTERQKIQIANSLAGFCIDQNIRFDRERWMDYLEGKCGPSGGKL